MSAFWIGVAAGSHVRRAVEGGFAMFAHGRRSAVARLSPGDGVTYYAPREGMGEGEELRAFTAIGVVTEGEVAERQMAPGVSGACRPVRWLADARAASIYPLLDRLSFIADSAHWGMYFRRSLFPVSEGDFAIIAGAMGVDPARLKGVS